MLRLAVDVMGGDNAPACVIQGVAGAQKALNGKACFLLFGDEAEIRRHSAEQGLDLSTCEVYHTTQVVGCDEAPTAAIRNKKDSSLVRAVKAVADGTADCVLSAGSSGALLAGATLIIRRLAGVKRPALAPLLPQLDGGCMMIIDSGANADCRPSYLQQFALMGTEYMSGVMGIENPRVALLNNGTESEKGNELTKTAFVKLEQTPGINFIGNLEAREVLSGACDIMVCDGFDGNILLKATEGVASSIMAMLKTELSSSLRTKLGAGLAMPAFKTLKKRMDYKEYGGAPLLGVKGGVIKAHGSSDGKAIMNAIFQADKLVRANVAELIGKRVASMDFDD